MKLLALSVFIIFGGLAVLIIYLGLNTAEAAPITIGIKNVRIHYFVDEEHNAECWVVYKKSIHFGGAGISCLRLQLEGIQLLPVDIWPGGTVKPNPKWIPSPLELKLDEVSTQP